MGAKYYQAFPAWPDYHPDGIRPEAWFKDLVAYVPVSELLAAEAKLTIAQEALESLSLAPHEGQGFCYKPYGTRKCSCHVGEAQEALANINKENLKTQETTT